MSSPALQTRAFSFDTEVEYRPRHRLWLHGLLLLLTLATTTIMGARMQYNFDHSLPFFDIDRDFYAMMQSWRDPAYLLAGLPYSLTILTILMAHEMGHYLACVYYRIDASLPYFLPVPTFTGTWGAFIKIRSAILTKGQLFDIGVAGPIAGFIFLLPALTVGLAMSKVVPGIGNAGTYHLGTPIIMRLFEMAVFPGVPSMDLCLHPVVCAGWVGLFATSMNLLPIGQLDGGHILYAIAGRRHKLLSMIFTVALLPLSFWWAGWLLWAVFLLVVGRRHPAIYDPEGIGKSRRKLALLALALFVFSFMPAPI